jgi:hypothetical protein
MSKKSRWTLSLLGTLLLVFGLACLNYTRAANWEHHQEFARLHNLPPPSSGILYGGVASVVLGSGTVGFVIGRRS